MALEEKFEIQLDEEGGCAHGARPHAPAAAPLLMLMLPAAGVAQGTAGPCRCQCTPHQHAPPSPALLALPAGAEKISTVQEAADMIAQQVSSKGA